MSLRLRSAVPINGIWVEGIPGGEQNKPGFSAKILGIPLTAPQLARFVSASALRAR